MNISYRNYKTKEDKFKSVIFCPLLKKNRKMVLLVDKNLNPKLTKNNRSIFNLGDFRHNVIFDEERKIFDNLVNKNPKKFFDWDDGTRFNPKYKKDV